MKKLDISQEDMEILAAVANTYHALYVINMEDGTFVEKGTAVEFIENVIGTKGIAAQGIENMCRYIVEPSYIPAVRKFCELSTLNERLKENNWITMQFPSVNKKWVEGCFIAGKRNTEGDCNRVIWAVRDIDQLKQTELVYRAETKKQITEITTLNNQLTEYNDIIANAGMGVWHIYLRDGLAPRMQANEKMRELLAISDKQLTEKKIYNSWYDNIVPGAITSVQNSVQEMLSGKFSENTYQWKHPKQGIIYVRCGGTAITLPDGTRVLSGYHADVTDIVLKEEKQKIILQETKKLLENRNEELSKQLDIINAVAKTYSSIYYASMKDYIFTELGSTASSARSVIGQYGDSREAFNRMYHFLVAPEYMEKMREFTNLDTLSERLRHRDWISCQYLTKMRVWLEGSFIVADRDEYGEVEHFLWCTRDIDESKKKEMAYQKALEKAMTDAEAANSAKTAFLFNMSHDIRTPMNAILGYTELLRKHKHDESRVEDFLNKIHTSGDFLLSLINNVLEMARIESGKSILEESPHSILDVHEEIKNVYWELMRSKGLNFICECHIQTPYIFCDKVKINEIFLNLVSNAYKYTPAGGTVSMLVKELPGELPGYITLQTTIADTGIGMSKDYQTVMFEEFSREHTATETKIQGTGLGLPIVKKLIDLMGGSISVSSELGKGSSFLISLPHRIAEESKNNTLNQSEVIQHCFIGKRILLAEDNELNAEIAMEFLKEEGLTVDHAADGSICVDMLQNAPEHYYDLILMDIQMPNLDGYQATRIIRELKNSELSNIPIVAMTANAFDEDKHNSLMAGMNDHLAKPIEVSKLLEILAKYLRE